ncbi:hypothetical protein SNE40_005926 [Patella caerulea]|uniref:FLYWCH-type domain-containing protein n=1 Tax=Patella caerulea TaxID=87958 RepID=A0AAN8K6Z7_PATCE
MVLVDNSIIVTPTTNISFHEDVFERSMEEDMVCEPSSATTVPEFTVVKSGSQKGKDKLVDANGYTYVKKSSTERKVYWRCSIRTSKHRCGATVIQTMYPDEFVTGKITHNHPSQPGKLHAVIQRKEVKDVAISNPFRSARVIFEEVANKILQEDQPIYSRENPENLIRAANRIREKTRPKDPRDLDFIVS